MFKKVYILNPSEAPSAQKKQIHCSVCKTLEKSILYACESEHVICKNCQLRDATIKSTEHGDDTSEKEFDLDADIPAIQTKKPATKATDSAGGDRENGLVTQGINGVKEFCTEDDKPLVYKELSPKKSVEITLDYKNLHYQESKTSISANTDVCSKISESKEEDEVESCEVIDPRPNLANKNKIQSIPSSHNSKKDNKLLLLMAVRLPTSPIKLPNVKRDPSAIFTRSIHTQTEKNNEHASGVSTECLSKSGGSSDYKSCTSQSVLYEDEVLLLWLCKLDEAVRVFSITLLGEDKRRGYCYIGDAVHVRDKQDPSLLYDRSECLVVKGSVINRLFDPKGQITAIVSLIG